MRGTNAETRADALHPVAAIITASRGEKSRRVRRRLEVAAQLIIDPQTVEQHI